MNNKVQKFETLQEDAICWPCPACENYHWVPIGGLRKWEFNGDFENPTVSPSVKIMLTEGDIEKVCHFFIRNGRIEFCSDSTHVLAGKAVEMATID